MKNKGFTLVELLAIIVILAVIMVIAVPKILDVVNGSKSSAWTNNVGMIKKAIANNSQLLDPETGVQKYSISNLCSNPAKLKEVVKLEDTTVTCSNNVFTLTGYGQFAGKSATITCTNTKCSVEILKDKTGSNQEKPTEKYGLFDEKDNLVISYSEFIEKNNFDVEKAIAPYYQVGGEWRDLANSKVDESKVPENVLVKILTKDEYKNVTKIVIPEGITTIAKYAFYGCSSLNTIVLPDSVTDIGDYAFGHCGLLSNINIPEGISILKLGTFIYTYSLKSISLPSTLTEIKSNAFENSGLTSLNMPSGIKKIGNYAFAYCSSLENINWSNSLVDIGEYTFSGCSKLVNVDLPDHITNVGDRLFSNCTSLTSIKLPSNLVTLNIGFAEGATNLKSVSIPASVTTIKTSLMNKYDNYEKIVFENPNGWKTQTMSYDFNSNTTTTVDKALSSSDLSNPTKALELLKQNSMYNWTRSN